MKRKQPFPSQNGKYLFLPRLKSWFSTFFPSVVWFHFVGGGNKADYRVQQMWSYCITQCSFALFPYIPIFLSVRQHLGNLRIQNRLYLHILVLEQPALVEGVLKTQLCFPWASQKAFSFSGKYPINLCPQSKILWVTLKASPSYPETRCVFSSTLPHKISFSAPESKPAQAWPRPADLDGVEIPELNGKICPKNGKKK